MAEDLPQLVTPVPGPRSRELALAVRAMEQAQAYRVLLAMDSNITYTPEVESALERVTEDLSASLSVSPLVLSQKVSTWSQLMQSLASHAFKDLLRRHFALSGSTKKELGPKKKKKELLFGAARTAVSRRFVIRIGFAADWLRDINDDLHELFRDELMARMLRDRLLLELRALLAPD